MIKRKRKALLHSFAESLPSPSSDENEDGDAESDEEADESSAPRRKKRKKSAAALDDFSDFDCDADIVHEKKEASRCVLCFFPPIFQFFPIFLDVCSELQAMRIQQLEDSILRRYDWAFPLLFPSASSSSSSEAASASSSKSNSFVDWLHTIDSVDEEDLDEEEQGEEDSSGKLALIFPLLRLFRRIGLVLSVSFCIPVLCC